MWAADTELLAVPPTDGKPPLVAEASVAAPASPA
jgi:hypothetical protein